MPAGKAVRGGAFSRNEKMAEGPRPTMKLLISYSESLDILLMQNGNSWTDGANIAENVVAFANKGTPVAVEVSGAASLLRPVLFEDCLPDQPETCQSIQGRPDEVDIDRHSLRLMIRYDPKADVLSMECGLPMPFGQTIADGFTVFYDGEDKYGKFINGVRLENATKLLKPYLSP